MEMEYPANQSASSERIIFRSLTTPAKIRAHTCIVTKPIVPIPFVNKFTVSLFFRSSD